jgi:hypothetical protein
LDGDQDGRAFAVAATLAWLGIDGGHGRRGTPRGATGHLLDPDDHRDAALRRLAWARFVVAEVMLAVATLGTSRPPSIVHLKEDVDASSAAEIH